MYCSQRGICFEAADSKGRVSPGLVGVLLFNKKKSARGRAKTGGHTPQMTAADWYRHGYPGFA